MEEHLLCGREQFSEVKVREQVTCCNPVDTVPIPVCLLRRMSEAVEAFEELQDELEDYFLSQDAGLLARMQQARAHHLEGETRALEDLKDGKLSPVTEAPSSSRPS